MYDETPADPSLLNCTYPGRKNGTRDNTYNADYNADGGVNGTEDDPCSNIIDVGLYYNDVWSYELNCSRYADNSCQGPEGKDKTEHTVRIRRRDSTSSGEQPDRLTAAPTPLPDPARSIRC